MVSQRFLASTNIQRQIGPNRTSRGSLEHVSAQRLDPVRFNATSGATVGFKETLFDAILWPHIRQSNFTCAADTCQSHEIYYAADYYASDTDLSFMAHVDMPLFTVLVLWISTSYAIFSMPNDAHRIFAADETSLEWSFGSKTVMKYLISWNLLGCVLATTFSWWCVFFWLRAGHDIV